MWLVGGRVREEREITTGVLLQFVNETGRLDLEEQRVDENLLTTCFPGPNFILFFYIYIFFYFPILYKNIFLYFDYQ